MSTNRPLNLLQIRPQILSASINKNMSSEERFQNSTLRPIIKLQQPLFVEVFINYVKKHKSIFYDLSIEKKVAYIEHAIQRDMKFRNSLKGMIIGQFTIEEYKTYIKNSSALNKRILTIVKETLVNNLQLFEKFNSFTIAI
jgi:hypothetical protein